MTSIILYTTVGCHLCEEAEHMLVDVQARHSFNWQAVDIVDEADLMERYGIRIPVLKYAESEKELGWPFDHAMLLDFLQAGKTKTYD